MSRLATACPVLLGTLIALAAPVEAGDWRAEYTTPAGVNCCGIRDCRPLARGYRVTVGDKVTVFPGRPKTEITIVHPSRDHRIWVCTTGCAFMPGTS